MIDRQREGERRHANNNDASSRNRNTLPPCYTATATYLYVYYICELRHRGSCVDCYTEKLMSAAG